MQGVWGRSPLDADDIIAIILHEIYVNFTFRLNLTYVVQHKWQ